MDSIINMKTIFKNIILNKMGKILIANMLLTQATSLLAGIHW